MTKGDAETGLGLTEKLAASGKCRICGGEGPVRPWHGVECENCGSISVTHLPDLEELKAFYQSFGATYHGGGREHGALDRQKRYASRYLQLVKRYCKSGSVLDIGPANSPFPTMLADAGFQVSVADLVRPQNLDLRIPFFEITPEDSHAFVQKAGPKSYDVVTSFAVIEHTRNPYEWVRMMTALARPGGYLILTTPEVGRFPDRNALGRTRWFCPPEHLHLISSDGMKQLFEHAGCATVHTTRFELNLLRWVARYGLLTAEGIIGMCVRFLAPMAWHRAKNQRLAKGQGIAGFVYKKTII